MMIGHGKSRRPVSKASRDATEPCDDRGAMGLMRRKQDAKVPLSNISNKLEHAQAPMRLFFIYHQHFIDFFQGFHKGPGFWFYHNGDFCPWFAFSQRSDHGCCEHDIAYKSGLNQ